MSILIQGMAMPNRCFECIFLTTVPNFFCLAGKRDLCAEHGINISRPNWCPLIEVHTPHGRLIDADALINELASEHVGGLEAIKIYTGADTWTGGLHTAWRTIDDADTVIEAED